MLAQETETLEESFGFAGALFFGNDLQPYEGKIMGIRVFRIPLQRMEGNFLPRITSPKTMVQVLY